LSRKPRKLPSLKIKRKVESIFDFKFEDFEIINYDPHPHIKGSVSV
jgi:thymidylate synthase